MMRPIVAAGWLCLLLLCCGARTGAPIQVLPSARCLTPEGKELDFADLVARECSHPKEPMKKSSPKPKPSDGPKAHGYMVTTTEYEKGDKGDCERGVTARELQRNIVDSADARCVAQILIQTGSVGGIEDGYRIDPDFNFLPNCKNREFDPDVVALKGIALGLLEGSPRDKGLVDKVADGVVPSFTPPGERFSDQSKKGKGTHSVDRDAFAGVLRNSTLLLETFIENANNSPPCKKPPTKPGKSYSGRRSLLSNAFGDSYTALSAEEDFVGFSARHLECSACDNADGYTCAYCWQEDVCGDLYWCNGG